MSGCSILIVEDDREAADVFVPMLSPYGYDVRIAADAEAGFREMCLRPPAALLVDLHLPVVDGLAFLRRLRQSAEHRHVPAAILTGDYLLDDAVTRELAALDADLYFKPVWEEDLLDIVRRLVASAAEFSVDRGIIPTSARPTAENPPN
jgi:CheY-like chemotaxis protein